MSDIDMMYFGEEDKAICPKCLHIIDISKDVDLHETVRFDNDSTTTWCEECQIEVPVVFKIETHFEQTDEEFAKVFMMLRGYDGTPSSWGMVGHYLSRFILGGDREKMDVGDKDEQFQKMYDEAYELVLEYVDKPLRGDEVD